MSQAELTTSATDLIMAMLVFVLTGKLYRKPGKQPKQQTWRLFFLFLGIASFLGFVNHGLLPENSMARRVFWIFLYASLFYVTFLMLAVSEQHFPVRQPRLRSRILWWILSAALYLPAAGIYLFTGKDTLFLYLIYGAVIAVLSVGRFLILALQKDKTAQMMLFALAWAAIALLCEFFKFGCFHLIWDFDENSTTHFFLMVSIICIYAASQNDFIDPKKL